MTRQLTDLAQAQALATRGALFVLNNSGGKDSQAMLAAVRQVVPASQILVVHAELPGVEWRGTAEHAKAMSEGLEFRIVRAGKTFLGMVESTGRWPSPVHRQCTSDLKRGPIEKLVRAYIKEKGLSGLVVNCMGIRAEESAQRACGLDKAGKKAGGTTVTLKANARNSKAGREWYDWLPIHGYTVADVKAEVIAAGQELHWAYAAGMTRLSCCFCIMASKADLATAARLNPALYAQYAALERKIGKTMFAGKGGAQIAIEDFVGVKAEDAA